MTTSWLRGLIIPGLLLASTATTQANDIVDFLNALNGGSRHRNAPPAIQPVRHDHHGGPGMTGPGHDGRELTSRDIYKLRTTNRAVGYGNHNEMHHGLHQPGGHDRGRLPYQAAGQVGYGRPSAIRSSGPQISFRLSAGSGMATGYASPVYAPAVPPFQTLPPVQTLPPGYGSPVMQGHPYAGQLPHQIGEIVDCEVPLATCVVVQDACRIAPNAVPVTVAVRDPSLCAHECHERLVYVQVFVPPCPPRSIRISPCHTRVTMCFGRYDVDIKSANGIIVVDYDN